MKLFNGSLIATLVLIVALFTHPNDTRPKTQRDALRLLQGSSFLGGSWFTWQLHKSALQKYRSQLKNWALLKSSKRPIAPSLYTPLISGLLAGHGLHTLHRWYNSNVPSYYQIKK